MNRRQFLTWGAMAPVAVAVAPVAALAAKPEFAMGGTLAPGAPYIVGESVHGMILTSNQVRDMEDAWEQCYVGIPARRSYYPKFDPIALLRGDAPHKA